MTSPSPSASRELARRLLDREQPGAERATAAGAAMQRVCTRLSGNLRASVGHDGFDALVARALRQVERDHPALKEICRSTDSGIVLDGVVASIERHGQHAVREALESLLTALVDLLSSLIGADMVLNLLDGSPPTHDRGHAS